MQWLSVFEWRSKSECHYNEIIQYTHAARQRRARQEKHPVLDFLHSYYTYSLGSLEKWHPGLAYELEIALPLPRHYHEQYYFLDKSIHLNIDKLTHKQRDYFRYIRNLLAFTQARSPNYSCYGLHEWAMLYRKGAKMMRHEEQVPLRLAQLDIDAVVDSREIVCTHFDAYRFFTSAAQPFNKLNLTLNNRIENEQPACIHANMDLYKWAYKCMPWIGSDLLKKTFLLATKAREIDMRASPYELSSFGYEAIPVETAEGRAQYVQLQKALAKEAEVLRGVLIDVIDCLLKN